MMSRARVLTMLVAVLLVGGSALTASALAGGGGLMFRATLSGYSEVPALSTTATGSFTATVSADMTTIDYELTYSGMSSTVSASHIHFAQAGVNGGVVAFLCGGGDKPTCPATEGTVSGTIDAADILDVAGQGISAGEIDEAIPAMVRRATYVNVHSSMFAGGELRGQIARTG